MSQNEDLKKIADGVVGFCDEMRTYLENTKESFDRVLNTNYHVNTAPIITKTLEQEYEDIVATDEIYEHFSAVGYRAILQNGDTVMVTGNSGHFFLNGERMTADYTYTGDGCEMVSVWVFEDSSSGIIFPIKLNDTPSFTPYEIIIKKSLTGQVPTVNNFYYIYTNKIETSAFNLPTAPLANKVIVSKGFNELNQKLSLVTHELISDCEKLTTNLSSYTNLKRLAFPELRTIESSTWIVGVLGSATDWTFGKLETIKNSGKTAIFSQTHTVYIPNTVKSLIGLICNSNVYVKLECNNAIFIEPNWCVSTPTNFSMAKDWGATVNIAVAAKKWGKDEIVDLFENYLRDLTVMSDDGTIWAEQTLTIPQAVYDILTEEEFAIAKNKGWSVGGA